MVQGNGQPANEQLHAKEWQYGDGKEAEVGARPQEHDQCTGPGGAGFGIIGGC
tara:strand:+ start:371 stop:529 length:159 start_codon:yes stop_codon:yes gene_type:complete